MRLFLAEMWLLLSKKVFCSGLNILRKPKMIHANLPHSAYIQPFAGPDPNFDGSIHAIVPHTSYIDDGRGPDLKTLFRKADKI